MIELKDVKRCYSSGAGEIRALDGVSLQISGNEFIAVTGPSGCGKSTLLHLLGGLDRPSSGEVLVDGVALHRADDKVLTAYRRTKLGMVFQFFNLLPSMTVVENIELPLLLQGASPKEARLRAKEMADLVGMADRLDHFPHQLSGGQMQRAAIARSLVHRPSLLLADEPTGNLDSENAERVIQTLAKIASQQVVTMVIVTHSQVVAAAAARQIPMLDGKLSKPRN